MLNEIGRVLSFGLFAPIIAIGAFGLIGSNPHWLWAIPIALVFAVVAIFVCTMAACHRMETRQRAEWMAEREERERQKRRDIVIAALSPAQGSDKP